jgi:uncharacterized DUF497 family protein
MIEAVDGFNWDDGNRKKCLKHGVRVEEIEHYEAQSQDPSETASPQD